MSHMQGEDDSVKYDAHDLPARPVLISLNAPMQISTSKRDLHKQKLF